MSWPQKCPKPSSAAGKPQQCVHDTSGILFRWGSAACASLCMKHALWLGGCKRFDGKSARGAFGLQGGHTSVVLSRSLRSLAVQSSQTPMPAPMRGLGCSDSALAPVEVEEWRILAQRSVEMFFECAALAAQCCAGATLLVNVLPNCRRCSIMSKPQPPTQGSCIAFGPGRFCRLRFRATKALAWPQALRAGRTCMGASMCMLKHQPTVIISIFPSLCLGVGVWGFVRTYFPCVQ